jgi:hypothetical protein
LGAVHSAEGRVLADHAGYAVAFLQRCGRRPLCGLLGAYVLTRLLAPLPAEGIVYAAIAAAGVCQWTSADGRRRVRGTATVPTVREPACQAHNIVTMKRKPLNIMFSYFVYIFRFDYVIR